jgi:hypothetical protein
MNQSSLCNDSGSLAMFAPIHRAVHRLSKIKSGPASSARGRIAVKFRDRNNSNQKRALRIL